MLDGIHRVDEIFARNPIKIITFNYDRSLEQFLYWAIKASFRLGDEQVFDELRKLPLLHVYGEVVRRCERSKWFSNTSMTCRVRSISGSWCG